MFKTKKILVLISVVAIFTILIISCIILGNCLTAWALQPPSSKFTDINDDNPHWATPQIISLATQDIINGYPDGSFRPEGKITREEFVVILTKAFECVNDKASSKFTDVEIGHWAYIYIASAQEEKIAEGMGNSTFGIGLYVTRQDVATFLYRALDKFYDLKLLNKDTQDEIINKINDYIDISDYAKKAIAFLKQEKIINGYPDGHLCQMQI